MGYDFHMALTSGDIAWTDDRVRATMANYQQLIDGGFFLEKSCCTKLARSFSSNG